VYEVEQMMTESGFLNEAMEGLSDMKDKQRIATILHELNSKLQVKTQKQKRKYQPLFPNQQTLTLVVLITILLLVILGFVIYKMSQTQ
jgi:thiosulfate reductase cytochrome b subunit